MSGPQFSSSLLGLIDQTEGAGNYRTLYGHSQRPGGRFSDVDVTRMTLDQLATFQAPGGAYGQWVKQQLANSGQRARVATPVGRYQTVGTTVRSVTDRLGLPGDTLYTRDVQDRVATHLIDARLSNADTPAEKREQLRSEWEGFRHVPDADLDRAISQHESGDWQNQANAHLDARPDQALTFGASLAGQEPAPDGMPAMVGAPSENLGFGDLSRLSAPSGAYAAYDPEGFAAGAYAGATPAGPPMPVPTPDITPEEAEELKRRARLRASAEEQYAALSSPVEMVPAQPGQMIQTGGQRDRPYRWSQLQG